MRKININNPEELKKFKMEISVNNKCKAFTSLEQSRKLAEILPLESADMKWYFWKDEIDVPKLPTFGYSKDAAESYKDTEAVYLPCWSLASLLDVIPQELFDGEYIINITEGIDNKWVVFYEPSYENYPYLAVSSDSLIDCCVEMIIKLKEKNLL